MGGGGGQGRSPSDRGTAVDLDVFFSSRILGPSPRLHVPSQDGASGRLFLPSFLFLNSFLFFFSFFFLYLPLFLSFFLSPFLPFSLSFFLLFFLSFFFPFFLLADWLLI